MQSQETKDSEFLPKTVKMTPMLKQWSEAKSKAKDALLLFRMGDFYELFADDAVKAAPVLELALTSRDKEKETAVAMAGFPHHAAPSHIAKLIANGFKVAICDQMEDPKLAKGIVKRDITQIVTPGTVIDEGALAPGENNFLVSIVKEQTSFGVAAADWSTGEFVATRIIDFEALCDEIVRLSPSEILVNLDSNEDPSIARIKEISNRHKACLLQKIPRDQKINKELFSSPIDDWFFELENKAALLAAQQLLSYLTEAQGAARGHLREPKPYSAEKILIIDAVSQRHLNLVPKKGTAHHSSSLIGTMNQTKTPMGSRLLHKWIVSPSSELQEIVARHEAVDSLISRPDIRKKLANCLQSIFDLERITSKAAIGRVSPREMGNLRNSLEKIPELISLVQEMGEPLWNLAQVEPLEDVCSWLSDALSDSPPVMIQDGGIFKKGYDTKLDELIDLTEGGRERVASVESREKEKTGISSLKIGYTRVFGYYIEVTKTHLSKVPEHYKRKQTIANGERYVTEELVDLEELISAAHSQKLQRESELFSNLREKIAACAPRLLAVASNIAKIDVVCSFANIAEQRQYVKPKMQDKEDALLEIKDGRHPIIERLLAEKGQIYVPNDLYLEKEKCQVALITGPNMAGKSTIMRQAALIQILAQAGSFVPAKQARLSVCDRIFTRVGASDDIDEGRSTFMVEMAETAQILKNASRFSLVLLDEIGRGTSTYDGLSIAWSVAEHIHDNVLARTLFATHYHEMTSLSEKCPKIRNLHVAVDESARGIEFLYLLKDGAAQRSYGIHVAELAGLPNAVTNRARSLLDEFEATREPNHTRESEISQMDLFGPALSQSQRVGLNIAELLGELQIDLMTPKQALDWIYVQQNKLKEILL